MTTYLLSKREFAGMCAVHCTVHMIISGRFDTNLGLLYLQLCLRDVTVVQYAGDTRLSVCGSKHDIQRLISSMEQALSCVYDWFCHNEMKLNANKTQMLVLGTPAMLQTLPPVVRFGGNVIVDSREVKNLGVYIDRHLNFETHVSYMSRKCTGILIAPSHRYASRNTETDVEVYCRGSRHIYCAALPVILLTHVA